MRFLFASVLVLATFPGHVSAAPAARLGDPTAHGGVITTGSPTVVIGGRPAARLGDFATCPLFQPFPPAPHVGGPIVDGSVSVLINGLPAARVGDLIVEAVSTSAIATGHPTVLIP